VRAVDYICDAIVNGARVHFNGDRTVSRAVDNRRSALQHADLVRSSISDEVSLGRMAGPFDPDDVPFSWHRVSPIGVVPKKDSKEHRLIVDLSYPLGIGVNGDIQDLMVLKYKAFDNVVDFLSSHGPGAILAKWDVAHAYRNVPVHPEDVPLLGMCCDGQLYFDRCLPFGLRSSPKIWERFARSLQWIIRQRIPSPLSDHYVDDFIQGWFPGTSAHVARQHMIALFALCEWLGIPVKHAKTVWPTTLLEFLGWIIDTVAMTISLPDAKRRKALKLIDRFVRRAFCTRKQLKSLIGTLHHLCLVIRQGRPFLGRMYARLSLLDRQPWRRRIEVSDDLREDCQWWSRFIVTSNGVAIVPPTSDAAEEHIFTDACAAGYGAVLGTHWLHALWSDDDIATASRDEALSISYLEALAVVRALYTWAPARIGGHIHVHCDNKGVVDAWQRGLAHDDALRELTREIMLISVVLSVRISISHIAGVDNRIADSLSRANLQEFRRLLPDADEAASPVQLSMPELWRRQPN
jgi:hypothetical protein